MWRIWCKALGEKAGKHDREADNIAYIRTLIFFTYFLTNLFIIAGVLRHWNDDSRQFISPGRCISDARIR